uniref:Uncharacterized protein n=1 Tax=Avena sativa TaxID=4498 RepID=A0ACD5ZF72_AVESA
MSVVKGLKLELQQAHTHIKELKQERRGYRHEVASLMRQLSEDKLVRKNKNREKIEGALCSLQDVEGERHLRWHSEDLHRKSGRELSEIKSAFLKAIKDLEKEKKTNRLLEDLCDQFALGIRNYEDEVSLLKQRHVNYEHKFDKSVLHISEAWLDERMQMQNIDVQQDLLQKATVTEKLSSEIEAFLLAKKSASSKNNDVKCMNYTRRGSSLRRQSLESVHLNGTTSVPQVAEEEEDDDDDSVASDLHCFELNMHGNGNRNHRHTGPHRSGTGSTGEPNRTLGYSYSSAGESSHISCVPIYAQKDKARSSNSNPQYVNRTLEINSHGSTGIAPAEVSYTNISRGSHIDALNHNLEGRLADCLGQESLDHYSRTSLFCEGTNSGDLCNPHSPSRQRNYQSMPSGCEIFECSPELPVGVKENTLKAKLLQARLEGRHA